MSLALRPRLLMLDEPTAGMGDQETYDIARLIRRLHRQQGLTIMLIEHDMRVVFNLADRIMVLAEGRVLAEGTPQEIADSDAVQARLSRQGRRMIALEADAIHTFYGKSHILHGVSLEVREGEIVALLGRNGAGKTTTLRTLIGLNRPREGRVDDVRRGRDRISALQDRPDGRRLRAGRAAHLFQSDGRGESAGPGRAAGRMDDQPHLRDLSEARRAKDQQGRPAFRRRAGDAVDLALAPAQSEAARCSTSPRRASRR